jgi:hypothetical protein
MLVVSLLEMSDTTVKSTITHAKCNTYDNIKR